MHFRHSSTASRRGPRSRAIRVFGTLLLAAGLTSASPQQDASPDNRSCEANYVIEASVHADPDWDDQGELPGKRLDGQLTLTWVNNTQDAVDDLWFHLHHNAYKSNQSLHLTESKGRLRRHVLKRGWGYQEVTAISAGGTDLMPSLTFQKTRRGKLEDETVFSVDLPYAVPAGGSISVDITWESHIPRVRRRTGSHGDFLFMSHWFPKLGVYEGGRGWNCHQFHMNTEFYADYGTYDVTLELPAEYRGDAAEDGEEEGDPKVGGSGVMLNDHKVLPDGRVQVRFQAPSQADRERVDPLAREALNKAPRVHGFAWTADPNFVVKNGTFSFATWKDKHPAEVDAAIHALQPAGDQITLRDVKVRVLIQPERESQWKRHYEATCAALFFYGLWFGEYPYEQITVVDPAWGAGAAGGMEYPTLITCGTRMFTHKDMHSPEGVTVHEAGHQFWYGLVGNNEYEAAWLDEGLNSYTDSEVLFREYGPERRATWYGGLPVWGKAPGPQPESGLLGRVLDEQGWDLPAPPIPLRPFGDSAFLNYWRDQPRLTFVQEYTDPRHADRRGYLRDPESDPIEAFAFEYVDSNSYRTNSYPRTAAALRSLAGVVGQKAFLRGMRNFSEAWRYRHPYPDDFYAAFIEGSGVDVSWYFDDVFRGSATVDWRVDVGQSQTPKPRGLRRDEALGWVPIDSPEPAAGADTEEGGKPWTPDVVVRRSGDLRLPLTIKVTYERRENEDIGEAVYFEWSREDQDGQKWFRLPLEPDVRRIAGVELDPEHVYYLDRDLSNNQWWLKSDTRAPLRWLERSTTWSAGLLQWFSRIGG